MSINIELNSSTGINVRVISGIYDEDVIVRNTLGPALVELSMYEDFHSKWQLPSGMKLRIGSDSIWVRGYGRINICRPSEDPDVPPIPVDRMDKLPPPYFYQMNGHGKLEIAKPDENGKTMTVFVIGSLSTDYFGFWSPMGGLRYQDKNDGGREYNVARMSPAGDGLSAVFGNYYCADGSIIATSGRGTTQLRGRIDKASRVHVEPTGDLLGEEAQVSKSYTFHLKTTEYDWLMRCLTLQAWYSFEDVAYNVRVVDTNTGVEYFSLQPNWDRGIVDPIDWHATCNGGERFELSPNIPFPALHNAHCTLVVEFAQEVHLTAGADDPTSAWLLLEGNRIERSMMNVCSETFNIDTLGTIPPYAGDTAIMRKTDGTVFANYVGDGNKWWAVDWNKITNPVVPPKPYNISNVQNLYIGDGASRAANTQDWGWVSVCGRRDSLPMPSGVIDFNMVYTKLSNPSDVAPNKFNMVVMRMIRHLLGKLPAAGYSSNMAFGNNMQYCAGAPIPYPWPEDSVGNGITSPTYPMVRSSIPQSMGDNGIIMQQVFDFYRMVIGRVENKIFYINVAYYDAPNSTKADQTMVGTSGWLIGVIAKPTVPPDLTVYRGWINAAYFGNGFVPDIHTCFTFTDGKGAGGTSPNVGNELIDMNHPLIQYVPTGILT